MKKTLIIISLGLFLLNCKSKSGYEINAEAIGVGNGKLAYLKYVNNKGREVYVDTAVVKNEKFQMKGSVSEPKVYFINIDGVRGELFFMLENTEITIKIDKNNILDWEFSKYLYIHLVFLSFFLSQIYLNNIFLN